MIRQSSNTVLVIDDDADMAEFVSDVASLLGFDPVVAKDGGDCLRQLKAIHPACIVMDVVMPDMDGVELLNKFAELNTDCPIVVMSGYDGKYLDSVALIAEANGLTILGKLQKPFVIDDLEELFAKVEPGVPDGGSKSV
ncbi:response regulator [Hwanghaeella grinnelliae]|nr:response regulator [Hwanghaeella grinnelliae]